MTARPFPKLAPSRRARKVAEAKSHLAQAVHALYRVHLDNLERPGETPASAMTTARLVDQLNAALRELLDHQARLASVDPSLASTDR